MCFVSEGNWFTHWNRVPLVFCGNFSESFIDGSEGMERARKRGLESAAMSSTDKYLFPTYVVRQKIICCTRDFLFILSRGA